MDFIVTVIPSCMQVMLCDHKEEYYAQTFLFCMYIGVIFVALLKKKISFYKTHILNKLNQKKNLLFEYPREFLMLNTCICIMGIDFPPNFPSLAKTLVFGCSFMDAGIALTICGTASSFHRRMSDEFEKKPFTRSSTLQILKRSITRDGVLLIIALIRAIFLLVTDFDYDINEYGVHWNFFFSLCALDVSVMILIWITGDYEWKPLWLSFAILVIYSTSLKFFNLEDLFLSPRTSSFFGLNYEGILSALGFPFLHFAASYLTRIIDKSCTTFRSQITMFIKLTTVALLLAIAPSVFAYCAKMAASFNDMLLIPIRNSAYSFVMVVFDIFDTIGKWLHSMERAFEMPPSRKMNNFTYLMRCLSYREFSHVFSWIFAFVESLIIDSPSSDASSVQPSSSSSHSPDTSTFHPSSHESSSQTVFGYLFSRRQFITFLVANLMIGPVHLLFDRPKHTNTLGNIVIVCVYMLCVCGASYPLCLLVDRLTAKSSKSEKGKQKKTKRTRNE